MSGRLLEIGGALSRLLGAFAGGKRATTFSAESHYLAMKGRWHGKVRVAVIDLFARCLAGERDHCLEAYRWHYEHGLYIRDPDDVPMPIKPVEAVTR